MKLPLRRLQKYTQICGYGKHAALTAALINKQITNHFHLAVSAVEKKMEG